jgi:hypothetical protein
MTEHREANRAASTVDSPPICASRDIPAVVPASLLIIVTCTLAFITTGCLHPRIGPQSLPRDRTDYSMSLSDSWNEQTLLNIVKVRYIDTPIFVDVGSVISSYTLMQTASAGGTIATSPPSSGMLGGSVSFSNTPTITYTPLTGDAYIKALTTQLPISTALSAIESGAPAKSIMLAVVKSINGLRSERIDPDSHQILDPDQNFIPVLGLLEKLHGAGALRFSTEEDANKQQVSVLLFDELHGASAMRVSTEEDANKQQVSVLELRSDISQETQNIRDLRRLLNLNPTATKFTIVSGVFPSKDTEIAIQTRSITGLLHHMAAHVEVPPRDTARVFPIVPGPGGSGGIPMIRIRSSQTKPEAKDTLVRVQYRGNWFWISDIDIDSKRSFALLMQLFTMTESGPKENQPVPTIPATR